MALLRRVAAIAESGVAQIDHSGTIQNGTIRSAVNVTVLLIVALAVPRFLLAMVVVGLIGRSSLLLIRVGAGLSVSRL